MYGDRHKLFPPLKNNFDKDKIDYLIEFLKDPIY